MQFIKTGTTVFKNGNNLFRYASQSSFMGTVNVLSGFSNPGACIADYDRDLLFVQNRGNNTVSILNLVTFTPATPSIITQAQGSFSFGGNNYGGNAMDIDKINGKLIIANRGNHTVSMLSLSNPTAGSPVVISTSIGGFSTPTGVAVDAGNGKLLVANSGNNTVSVLPLANPTTGGLPAIGAATGSFSGPSSICMDITGGRIIIGNTGQSISVIPYTNYYAPATSIGFAGNVICGVAGDPLNNKIFLCPFYPQGKMITVSYSAPNSVISTITNLSISAESNSIFYDSKYGRLFLTGASSGQIAVLQNIFT